MEIDFILVYVKVLVYWSIGIVKVIRASRWRIVVEGILVVWKVGLLVILIGRQVKEIYFFAWIND